MICISCNHEYQDNTIDGFCCEQCFIAFINREVSSHKHKAARWEEDEIGGD